MSVIEVNIKKTLLLHYYNSTDIYVSEVKFDLDKLNSYLFDNKIISTSAYKKLTDLTPNRQGWVFQISQVEEDEEIKPSLDDNFYIRLYIDTYFTIINNVDYRYHDLNIIIPMYLFYYFLS